MARDKQANHAATRSGTRRARREAAAPPQTRRPVRVPAARHFQPGQVRPDEAGTELRCLVLVPGPDWVAVDLDTGALLRAPAGSESIAAPGASSGEAEGGDPADPGAAARWPQRVLSAVQLTLGDDSEPPDPARPEAVVVTGRPVLLGEPRRRTTRRLLHELVTKASDRPLLGTLGPSISYGDLDGTRPSVVIVAPQARPRFGVGPTGPWCQFSLGGRRHTMPCTDTAAPDASATGHGTKLLVVALGAPRRGQVPKVVLGTLPLGR